MAMPDEMLMMSSLRHEAAAIRGNWFWFVLLGIGLVAIGTVALGSVGIASLATALVLGSLILLGGVAETLGAFWCRAWSGFFFHLLSGILAIVIGALFLRAPVDAVLALTLLVACYLMVGGIFKIVSAASYRFAAWGWTLFGGVIDVVLGVMIWVEWPDSALWVIGLFVGISLIFRGFNWIGLGMALRSAAEVDDGLRASSRDGSRIEGGPGGLPERRPRGLRPRIGAGAGTPGLITGAWEPRRGPARPPSGPRPASRRAEPREGRGSRPGRRGSGTTRRGRRAPAGPTAAPVPRGGTPSPCGR